MVIRDDVLIVLNERQPLKAERAAELAAELEALRISCCRIIPTAETIDAILERRPRVVVLDYLLGDFTTAIEVLERLRESQGSAEPILYTDERSLSAAVAAMKLGARDYIDLEHASSVHRIAQTIHSLVRTNGLPTAATACERPASPRLVYQSATIRQARAQALRLAAQGERLVILFGPRGSGRSVLADEMHLARTNPIRYSKIDYDLWTNPLFELFGSHEVSAEQTLLSNRSTLFIDHVEADQGELLEAASAWHHSSSLKSTGSMLIVGTRSLDDARAWKRLSKGALIELPSLDERFDDFLPLAQLAASNRSSSKLDFVLSHHLLDQLHELCWPGNVAQFINAIEEASSCRSANQDVFSDILAAKVRWERFEVDTPQSVTPLSAALALLDSHGNLRIAAARCGTSVSGIRVALYPSDAQFLERVLVAGHRVTNSSEGANDE